MGLAVPRKDRREERRKSNGAGVAVKVGVTGGVIAWIGEHRLLREPWSSLLVYLAPTLSALGIWVGGHLALSFRRFKNARTLERYRSMVENKKASEAALGVIEKMLYEIELKRIQKDLEPLLKDLI